MCPIFAFWADFISVVCVCFLAGLGLLASLLIDNIKIEKEAHTKGAGAGAKGDPEKGQEKA